MRWKIILTSLLAILAVYLPAQNEPQVDLHSFFGKTNDFLFLKGIHQKIAEARTKKSVQSLCAYAALLYYAEHLSSQKNPVIDGATLLREATSIAWKRENIRELTAVHAVWCSQFFGPDDQEGAQAIQKFIAQIQKRRIQPVAELPKKEAVVPKTDYDPQKLLSAEEYARLDALERIAERVFGVLIQSVTSVKDFTTERDVVVATLKSSLLTGARFDATEVDGDEIRVPVVVTQKNIMASLRSTLLKHDKKMSENEKRQFEDSLEETYRVVGISFIEK